MGWFRGINISETYIDTRDYLRNRTAFARAIYSLHDSAGSISFIIFVVVFRSLISSLDPMHLLSGSVVFVLNRWWITIGENVIRLHDWGRIALQTTTFCNGYTND